MHDTGFDENASSGGSSSSSKKYAIFQFMSFETMSWWQFIKCSYGKLNNNEFIIGLSGNFRVEKHEIENVRFFHSPVVIAAIYFL